MTTESFRKEVARKLSGLQGDPDDAAKIEFSKDLTSSDRKYVHKIAESFRLPTLSQGVGAERYLVVYKTAPEGLEKKPERTAYANCLDLPAGAANALAQAAATAPPGLGRPLLANVTARSGKKLGQGKRKRPPAPGDEVEVYWPDDDTYLPATLQAVLEDGTYQIVWAEDGSESDVPADYVRRLAGGGGNDFNDAPGRVDMSVEVMEEALEKRRQNPGYAAIGEKREALPAFKQRVETVEIVRDNQVVLLSGETGCGKSTQVPQFIIDSSPYAKVLVMQPRKLAATTLAERIAAERCQHLGRDVGYEVPFGAKSPKAQLVFATLGVFRRRMITDPDLTGITHVVFDEVHERDKLADFNMIFVRDMLDRRPDLRVVLMSATLQMETFERYFEGAAKIDIPGRVFPVSELYLDEVAATLYRQPHFRIWLGPGILCGGIDIPAGAEGDWNEKAWKTVIFKHTKPEDKDTLWGLREKGLETQMKAPLTKTRLLDGLRKHDCLQQSSLAFDYPIIEALILHIDRMYKEQQKVKKPDEEEKPPGTVLVFLPGWGDIDQLQKRLSQSFDTNRFKILPLHSQVSPQQQQEIFEPAQHGIRKIVLTTNIAEASITVEGTEFVIDCGRAKEVSYDPYLKVGTLTTSWISQASSRQRAGRAGRTRGGLCFHLFCRERFDKVDEFLPPELLRSPLEDSALTAKLMLLQMGSTEKVSSFLAKAPDPPEQMAIENSLQILTQLGAFTKDEHLTALGEHLTKSPLPPRLAKTILWSILLGCLDDALCVVSAAGGFTRDPFKTAGMEFEAARELRRNLAKPHRSDHACLMHAVAGYTDATNQDAFCEKWKLSPQTMRQIRDQQNRLYTELHENKSEALANRNRGNFELLVAVLCAGIFPNVARRRGSSDFYEAQSGKVECRIHGSSAYTPGEADEWVFFQELSQMEASYRMKLVSPIDPLALLLLGGEGPVAIDQGGKGKGGKGKGGTAISLLDGWVKFNCDPSTAQSIQTLRASLQGAFQAFCQKPDLVPPQQALAMFDAVAALLGNKASDGPFASAGSKGIKRPAPGAAEGSYQRSMPAPRRPGGMVPPRFSKGGGGGGGCCYGGQAMPGAGMFYNPWGGGGGGGGRCAKGSVKGYIPRPRF